MNIEQIAKAIQERLTVQVDSEEVTITIPGAKFSVALAVPLAAIEAETCAEPEPRRKKHG